MLVLGGIARILRSFFPFLRSLENFQSGKFHNPLIYRCLYLERTFSVITEEFCAYVGWQTLLLFVRNSIFNGSKEVALAAVNCLQSTIVSHSPKVICDIFVQMPFLHLIGRSLWKLSVMNITECL